MDQFIVYNNIEIFDAAAPPAGEKVSFPREMICGVLISLALPAGDLRREAHRMQSGSDLGLLRKMNTQ